MRTTTDAGVRRGALGNGAPTSHPRRIRVALVLLGMLGMVRSGLIPSDVSAQQNGPISVQSGSGTIWNSGSGSLTLCCPSTSHSCDGLQTSATNCECNAPPEALVCWADPGDRCQGGVSGEQACVPTGELCPPPDNGATDEGGAGGGCSVGPKSCDPEDKSNFNTLGADPILAGARTAASTPFTDFEAPGSSTLFLTRTYSSADTDPATSGQGGIFGKAWRHDWEGYVTCHDGVCSVMQGVLAARRFVFDKAATSPDGSETWNTYRPFARIGQAPHHDLLAQRPNGEWLAFLAGGRTLRFAQVCTSCDGAATGYCTPAGAGGRARLVSMTDSIGHETLVSYDPANRSLLRLTDALGHTLEARTGQACGARTSELHYDGVLVASYTYQGNLLKSAMDADGRLLRSYTYQTSGVPTPRLRTILDESGTAVAEFSYDSAGRVVGLVDAESSLNVRYEASCDSGYSCSLDVVGGCLVAWAAVVCESSATATGSYRGRYGDAASTTTRTYQTATDVLGGGATAHYGLSASGGAKQVVSWNKMGSPKWLSDGQGHHQQRSYDELGRETYRIEYFTTASPGFATGPFTRPPYRVPAPIPEPLPADSRERWLGYGVMREVAQGEWQHLDLITMSKRPSALRPGEFTHETSDYSQAPAVFDPPGYRCTESDLPAGSALCRSITSGYVTLGGATVFERHATFFSYDAQGRLVRTLGPINLDHPGPTDVTPIEERTYYSDGDVLARRGQLETLKRYPAATSPPLVTTFEYGPLGVSRVTVPGGTTATISRDVRGRPTIVAYADSSGQVQARTETRYQDGDIPRLRILPDGTAQRYGYDTKGRLASVEQLSGDPEVAGATPTVGWSERYLYDPAGNRYHAERRDALGAVTWQQDRAFDDQHRVVWESHPSLPSHGRSWHFSGSGFLTDMQDEEGRITRFEADGLDRVGGVKRIGRDPAGQVISQAVATYTRTPGTEALTGITDGTGRAVNYRYDDFGRVEQVSGGTLGAGATAWFRHDARGNVVARGDATVNVVYQFDGLDRLLSVQASNSADGTAVSHGFGYDAPPYPGRLTSATGPDGITSYTYDWAGRLKSEVAYRAGVAMPLTTGFDYDAAGRLSGITYPSGLKIQLVRDPVTGEVTSVKDPLSGKIYASGIRHVAAGPWASLTFGNGLTLSQTFSLRGEPLTLRSGPLALDFLMTPAGDVGVVTDTSAEPSGCVRSAARSHTYDIHDRLVGWGDTVQQGTGVCAAGGLAGGVAGFSYVDGTDRIAARLGAGGELRHAFGYDGQGHVSAIAEYDAAGQVQVGKVCLRHDALGRLVLVGNANAAITPGGTACLTDAAVSGAVGRYRYDAQNRRVASQRNGVWTHTVFDPAGNPLSELVETGNPAAPWAKVRDYVWLDGRLLAQVEYAGGQARTYYAHLDHLGTPRALTSQSGQVVWSTYQRPYGEVAEQVAADQQTGQVVVTNLRLPGQYDERLFGASGITGLQGPYYNWNRWYLPSVGRYLEVDPIALGGGFNGFYGPNWYGYAEGNPLRWTDEEGREAFGSCWMKCIEAWRWDYAALIGLSAWPKQLLPPFRVVYQSQRLTTPASSLQYLLGEAGLYSGNALRAGGRLVSWVATPLLITEGIWDIGVVGGCAATCASEGPKESATCH